MDDKEAMVYFERWASKNPFWLSQREREIYLHSLDAIKERRKYKDAWNRLKRCFESCGAERCISIMEGIEKELLNGEGEIT